MCVCVCVCVCECECECVLERACLYDVCQQVAFFAKGSMLQLALSVLVSVAALVYHMFAMPFRDSILNGTQLRCQTICFSISNFLHSRDGCDWLIVICSAARCVPRVYLADTSRYVADRLGLLFNWCVDLTVFVFVLTACVFQLE